MEPIIKKNSYVFVEFNTPLVNKDIGLFSYNDKIIIRKFATRNGKITLKALNSDFEDIKVADNDVFYMPYEKYGDSSVNPIFKSSNLNAFSKLKK